MQQTTTNTGLVTAASFAALISLAGCSSDDTDTGTGSTPSGSTSTSTSSTASGFRDGRYTARGVYGGAPSYMTFTVTVRDGSIEDVSSELMPDNNDTSRGYQERFAAALPDSVTGEALDGLEVDAIAGASGCADGFNDALDKIREQASTDA